MTNIGGRERAAVRRQRALELRITGMPFREIGRQLGVSGCQAHHDIARSLAELAAREQDQARIARQLDLERINKALAGVMPKAEKGDPQAVNALVRLLELRARLLGLDAPLRAHHGGDPDAPPIAVEQLSPDDRERRLLELITAARGRAGVDVPALAYHPPDGAGAVTDA
jgi:hypothetical protein